MQFNLTKDTFLLYAIKCYDTSGFRGKQEFLEDIKRFRYIKKLLNRFKTSGELKERLILNHIIILYNMFGAEATVKMLFFKLDEIYWAEIKTFLLYLNLMPSNIILHNGQRESDIPLCNIIVDKLREL